MGLLSAPLVSASADEKAAPDSALPAPGLAPAAQRGWAMDSMNVTLYGERRFRTLNILDEGGREGLASEVDTQWLAEQVILAGSSSGLAPTTTDHSPRLWAQPSR